LLALPAILFSRTVENNRATIMAWLAPVRRRFENRAGRVTASLLGLSVTSVVAATVVHVFLEPSFPTGPGNGAFAVGMLIAFAVIVASAHWNWWQYRARHQPTTPAGRWRVYPEQIAVSAVLVAVSRLAHFVPGLMLGKPGNIGSDRELDLETSGPLALGNLLWLAGISLAAWFISIPVAHAAEHPHASFLTLTLDSTLTVLPAAGIQTLIFELIPLYFLEGYVIRRWNPRLWLATWAAAIVWFSIVVINPALSYSAGPNHASLVWLALLLAIEVSIAVGVWGFFAARQRTAARPAAPTPGETSSREPTE
jgi:hypothetical protein